MMKHLNKQKRELRVSSDTLASRCIKRLTVSLAAVLTSFVCAAGGVCSPLDFGEAASRPDTYLAEEMMISMVDVDETEVALANRRELLAGELAARYRGSNIVLMRQIVDEAYKAGEKYDIDPLLILSVIAVESGFDPKVTSISGAEGLMQVITRLHMDKYEGFGLTRPGYQVAPNIDVGTRILSEYFEKTGSFKTALKYYVGAAKLKSDGGYGKKVLTFRQGLIPVVNGVSKELTTYAAVKAKKAAVVADAKRPSKDGQI